MPRLLQITLQANVGSVGRIAEQIGLRAIERGWESHMTFARRMRGESCSELMEVGSLGSVMWHGLMTRSLDRHGLCSTAATGRLVRQIERFNPDIIQIHNLHGYWIDIRRLVEYLKVCGKPVVWTLHDCWAFTGHCAFFFNRRSGSECLRWQSGCYDCPLRKEYPASLFADRSCRNFELKRRLFTSIPNLTVVAVSEWLGSVVAKSFLNAVPLRVIRNGINLEAFTGNGNRHEIWRRYGLEPGRRFILGVASVWDSRKGLEDFIALRRRLPSDVNVVLVGLSEKQRRRLPSGIIGLCRTESVENLAALYSSASLFVNLSYGESLPTVNIEAQACGTPVLCYDTGGARETLLPGITGEVVPRGDVEALAATVLRMLDRNGAYLSTDCRGNAERRFCAGANLARYMSLYEELLSGR